jgi:replicative DNA helicase
MTKAKFLTAATAFDEWRDDVLTGKPPTFYRVAESGPLARLEIGPQLITLIGGAPGAGKTAFVMQMVFDALRLSPTLRAVVCNIEMPPSVLLDRQLARLSGVGLDVIRYRRIEAAHAERIDAGLATLDTLADRLAFVRPPFDLANVAATADEFAPLASGGGVLLVLDYIQRITPPGTAADKRGSVDSTMNYIRQFADVGAAVIVVSSVGRQKNNKGGSTYAGDSLNLASFKESGELEFGADDAFILTPGETARTVELKHLKARHTEQQDITLGFNGRLQTFTPTESDGGNPASAGLSGSLRDLWERALPEGAEEWQG